MVMKNIKTLVIMFFVLIFALSCSKGSESYYPLKEGNVREYQIKMVSGKINKLVVTNLASRELQGKKVTPCKNDVSGKSSFIDFIVADDSGVYVFARQRLADLEPEILKSPSYILKNPIQVGTTWEINYKICLVANNIPCILKETIESKNETVTVPAGTFKDCVKLKAIGYAQNINTANEESHITVEYYSWNAPGIGEIKEIIRETDKHQWGEVTREVMTQLESFKK